MRRMTYDQYKKLNDKYNSQFKQNSETIKKHIQKVKSHPKTRVILYPEYKEAFDYVDVLFPNASVKEAVIYLCDRKYLDGLGYKGVGGFFERVTKSVVIPEGTDLASNNTKEFNIIGKITIDEVLVHELLHYASDTQQKKVVSVELEEEFAYGNSVAYLKSKGYSDEDIVNNNFLPFLVQTVEREKIIRKILEENNISYNELAAKPLDEQKKTLKKFEKQIMTLIKEQAFKRGLEIIDVYTPKEASFKNVKIEDKTFDFMEF